ncbi:MAG: OmpA family protein [Myxococcota bacterium]|nr:OmpA family protein [Myxococcota bacterium]
MNSLRNALASAGMTLAILCALSISAHADGSPWSISATYQVKPGQKAKLTLGANQALQKVSVSLKGPKSESTASFASMKPGSKRTISFKVPMGRTNWVADIKAKIGSETVTSTFKFEIVSVGPLQIQLSKQGVKLDKGIITVSSNTPLEKAELVGFNIQGDQIVDDSVSLNEATGSVDIRFDALDPKTVRRIELKVHDHVGRWRAFRLVAWYVEIPHDDVIFGSGQANIEPQEAKKLAAVVNLIQKEIKAFRTTLGRSDVNFDLKLFVAGCTDTVGSEQDNLMLSRKRAKAIAGYFRSQGIDSPIFYEGYGEKMQAVSTADNVDEEKNRRAIYILTNTQPSGFESPGRRWRAL